MRQLASYSPPPARLPPPPPPPPPRHHAPRASLCARLGLPPDTDRQHAVLLRPLSHQSAPAIFPHTGQRPSSSSALPQHLTYSLPSYLHGPPATDDTTYARRAPAASLTRPALPPARTCQPPPAHCSYAALASGPPAAAASSLLPLLLDDAAWDALQEI